MSQYNTDITGAETRGLKSKPSRLAAVLITWAYSNILLSIERKLNFSVFLSTIKHDIQFLNKSR
jgi:hypothetical protein